MGAYYDRIGAGYAAVRKPDARLAAMITSALGAAVTVVNVGAGAGSYEPAGRTVVSVEPSAVMPDVLIPARSVRYVSALGDFSKKKLRNGGNPGQQWNRERPAGVITCETQRIAPVKATGGPRGKTGVNLR